MTGQSGTFFLQKHKIFGLINKFKFGVCSRNLRLKTEDNSSYWTIAKQYNIESNLIKLCKKIKCNNIVLQGEIAGDKIQKNKYGIKGYRLFVFNLIINGKKLDTLEIQSLLKPYGFETVPIICEYLNLPETIDEAVSFANGKSVLCDTLREGLVWRAQKGNNQISFKTISPDFLLKWKE